MPLLSNITLGTMQLDKYRPPGNHQNDFSIGLPKTFKRESVIRNSRGHLCAALVSSSSLLFNSASYALYCTCWWKAWIQLLGQSHPMNLSTRCSSANLKATLSLEVCCDLQKLGDLCDPCATERLSWCFDFICLPPEFLAFPVASTL